MQRFDRCDELTDNLGVGVDAFGESSVFVAKALIGGFEVGDPAL